MCTKSIKINGRGVFAITIDDEGTLITCSQNSKILGTIDLRHYEDGNKGMPSYYYITNLSYDKCKGMGLGTESLLFHKEIFDTAITANSHFSGLRSDDGSHLTGDGVGFIAKMRKKGIVEKSDDEE